MSIEKMKLVTLSGSLSRFEEAVQACVLGTDFHPVNAITMMRAVKSLKAFDTANPYAQLLDEAQHLGNLLNIPLGYRDFGDLSCQEATAFFEDLSGQVQKLEEKQKNLELEIEDNRQIINHLTHIHGVNERLGDFLEMQYVHFKFGRMPRSLFEEERYRIENLKDAFFLHTSIEDAYVYGLYFSLNSAAERVDAIFASLHFERVFISEKAAGTALETTQALDKENLEKSKTIEEISNELRKIQAKQQDKFLACYTYVYLMDDCFKLKSYAGRNSHSFYLSGWIPARDAEVFQKKTESLPSISCTFSDAEDVAGESPPIKLKSNFLSRIFAPFLEMYGLPRYGELDPSFFMASVYTLLFGIMFGDVGQGVVLSLFGFVLWKWKGMWLGRILACVGVSATAFGFLYGSVFGYEHILPGYKVLEGGNMMTILLYAVAAGILLIAVCMVLNIINGIRQRDPGKIFFSPNGLAGLILYVSVVIGVASLFLLQKNLFTTPYILGLIVLPILVQFLREPLTKLVRGEKDWMPKSIGSFFIEGFFELFETILSYLSNTISFLRVGAFAISHAGMMMVVFLLAGENESIFVIAIGNLVVMGIEGLLVCIQVLRLNFYELFSRFYDSGGVSFLPTSKFYIHFENNLK